MSKVTGRPIKYQAAQDLRNRAKTFQQNQNLTNTINNEGGGLKIFYDNLDCAFVFDKDSLLKLIGQILQVDNSGLLMMMGSSDDTTHTPSREHKPTLSVFPCTIDKLKNEFNIIHPDPQNPGNTDGVEHPGLVNLTTAPGINIPVGKGGIEFMQN